ncbi:MAG: hypothetical protein ACD_75C01419G0002 [uncultured bacterium]|nr:MAG: hypothetical protein ACD_75C01419G0002 [uncultured bacterium]
MKLLIIGAKRGIGKALLDCALTEDNEVTVLARTPEIPSGCGRFHIETIGGSQPVRQDAALGILKPG